MDVRGGKKSAQQVTWMLGSQEREGRLWPQLASMDAAR